MYPPQYLPARLATCSVHPCWKHQPYSHKAAVPQPRVPMCTLSCFDAAAANFPICANASQLCCGLRGGTCAIVAAPGRRSAAAAKVPLSRADSPLSLWPSCDRPARRVRSRGRHDWRAESAADSVLGRRRRRRRRWRRWRRGRGRRGGPTGS